MAGRNPVQSAISHIFSPSTINKGVPQQANVDNKMEKKRKTVKKSQKGQRHKGTKIKADTAVNSTQYAVCDTHYNFLDRIHWIYRDKI